MIDINNVIKGIECCLSGNVDACEKCPYKDECANTVEESPIPLRRDALSLLKEHKPVSPIIKQEMDDICSCIDNVAYCGRCGARIGRLKQNYCSECGQAVKWDG